MLATTVGQTPIPLGKGHFGTGQGESGDPHLPTRTLAGLALRLVGWAAHLKAPRRNHHHLGAARAIAEARSGTGIRPLPAAAQGRQQLIADGARFGQPLGPFEISDCRTSLLAQLPVHLDCSTQALEFALDLIDALHLHRGRGLRRHADKAACVILDFVGRPHARFRYDDGKWSLKQVLGHLIDTERVLLYRAMAAARGDRTRQPGFDQDAWEAVAPHDELDLEDLLEEFWLVRSTTLHFFRTVDADALTRRGVSGGGRRFTVGAMAWIIAGHEAHHLNVIDEKYLPGLP